MDIVRRKHVKRVRRPLRNAGEVTRWLEWSGSELRVRSEDGEAWSIDGAVVAAGLLRPEFAERDAHFLDDDDTEG